MPKTAVLRAAVFEIFAKNRWGGRILPPSSARNKHRNKQKQTHEKTQGRGDKMLPPTNGMPLLKKQFKTSAAMASSRICRLIGNRKIKAHKSMNISSRLIYKNKV